MSRIQSIRARVANGLDSLKAEGSPFPVPVRQNDLSYLLDELDGLRANVSALQRKLNACQNRHKQKDDMIGRRDRSLKKAHDYIERLKEELRDTKAELIVVAVELKKLQKGATA